MTSTIHKSEIYQGLNVVYSFSVISEGVTEVSVSVEKSTDGSTTKVERKYWRDMTFAPTTSESYLSDSENSHIAAVVQSIWDEYQDVQPMEIKEEE